MPSQRGGGDIDVFSNGEEAMRSVRSAHPYKFCYPSYGFVCDSLSFLYFFSPDPIGKCIKGGLEKNVTRSKGSNSGSISSNGGIFHFTK
ncbi:hypothetical protein POVCU1_001890 [Plasmodium ovale curtisi]|uniref:Uncharacterized protein n=1 Tax=Plasmodium ovale curtisi TaxID=864141 RepID=A0A1A8VJD3_PLAOA|nr:hypothetical protein POVCU1_001890 [Plasmodium ovale curtisi]